VLAAKDLFLNEASLTGEAMPVEKSAAPLHGQREAPTDLPNICFMGSHVLSGAGTAVVIQTGAGTCFVELARMLMRRRAPTSFDKGVTRFVAGAGALLPYTPLGSTLGFVPLPALYWPPVVVIILGYCVLAHLVKSWFVRRWGL
jgi:hypothetical protein